MKLAIEPIPQSSWGISLAILLPKEDWDVIRHEVYEKANYRCEVCGNAYSQLCAHEQWSYNIREKVQRLKRIECCCMLCHGVHHLDRYLKTHEVVEYLIAHWCRVNNLDITDFWAHVDKVMNYLQRISSIHFKIVAGKEILRCE